MNRRASGQLSASGHSLAAQIRQAGRQAAWPFHLCSLCCLLLIHFRELVAQAIELLPGGTWHDLRLVGSPWHGREILAFRTCFFLIAPEPNLCYGFHTSYHGPDDCGCLDLAQNPQPANDITPCIPRHVPPIRTATPLPPTSFIPILNQHALRTATGSFDVPRPSGP